MCSPQLGYGTKNLGRLGYYDEQGLEFIEAKWLFGLQNNDIQIVLHPQSVIHSMVQYCDGSVIAQMGNPDMRTPIAHALAFPERIESGVKPLIFLS